MYNVRNNLVLIILLSLVFIATACSTTRPVPTPTTTTLQGKTQAIPAHFKYIPADTPYLWTGFEPTPWHESLEVMSSYIDLALSVAREDDVQGFQQEHPFLMAVLEELEGKKTPEDFAKIGFSTTPHTALYGLGPLPVFRMELEDSQAFDAFLNRVEARAGLAVVRKSFDDVVYREYRLEDTIFPVAILDGEVVFGVAPLRVLDLVIPHIIGAELPEKSLAHAPGKIGNIIEAYDFQSFSAGYFEVVSLWDLIRGHAEEQSHAAQIVNAMQLHEFDLPEECALDYGRILGKAPRVVFGTYEFTREEVSNGLVIELDSELARQLQTLRAPIPGYQFFGDDGIFAALGLGVNMEQALVFFEHMAHAIQENPFQCEDFYEANEIAAQLPTLLPNLPPFASQLRGITLVAEGSDMLGADSTSVIALIRSTDALALYTMLSMFLPHLQSVNVQPGQPPVELKGFENIVPYAPIFIGISEQLIGVSLGERAHSKLTSLVSNDASESDDVHTPMLSMQYNLQPVFAWLSGAMDLFADESDVQDQWSQFSALTRSGPTRVDVDVDHRGILMRFNAKFTQPPSEKPTIVVDGQ